MTEARVYAPDLPESFQWVGTDEPLTLSRLRGNVVVLHFWTSG